MNSIKKIFIHKDGYLRSTLQIIMASFTFLFISIMGQDIIARVLNALIQSNVLPANIYESYFLTGILPEVCVNFISGLAILGLYMLINKKSISSIGVTSIIKNKTVVLTGMFTLIVMLSCITGVLYLIGDIKFTGLEFNASILQYFLLMTSVSFVEEILNRGFIQHLVRSRASAFWSFVIPSLVFMSFHIPGNTPISLINIFLAGFFFSFITHKLGNIWFAFGAHIIWNVGVACIFGLMKVSALTGAILNFDYTKFTAFNGYGVGPLSGIIGTVAWLIAIAVFSRIKVKEVSPSLSNV